MLSEIGIAVTCPNPKALKLLPELHQEAELEKIAEQINRTHKEIEAYSEAVLEAGIEAVKRAIDCGNWLLAVKAALGHGRFEEWCPHHLNFKIRKAQYYMHRSNQPSSSKSN